MKRLFKGLSALLIAALIGGSQISPAMANNVKVLTLRASATSTATTTGSAVSTIKRSNAISGDVEAYGDKMIVFLNCPTASGTLDVKVQGCATAGGTFTDLVPAAAWTQVTTAASHQTRTYLGPIPPFIKYVGTVAGAAPTYTYSMTAIVSD